MFYIIKSKRKLYIPKNLSHTYVYMLFRIILNKLFESQ